MESAINYDNEKKLTWLLQGFFGQNFIFLDKKVGKIHEILWLKV
jgi:hypothetical protein